MEGVIKSYVADKKYGFIDGNDNQSYFFHLSYLGKNVSASSVKEGMLVSFDPTPGQKGLQAKQLKIQRHQAVMYVPPNDFITSKSDGPKQIKVFGKTPVIEASSDNSPDEARKNIGN